MPIINDKNNIFTNESLELYNPFGDDLDLPVLTPSTLSDFKTDFNSPNIVTEDRKRLITGSEDTNTDLIPLDNDIQTGIPERPTLVGTLIESIKMATIAKEDVVRGYTTRKLIGEIVEDDTMFSSANVIKPDFEVKGLAPVAGNNQNDDITLIEITTSYGVTSVPNVRYYNVLHGYTTSPDHDAEIHVSTSHTYYIKNGVKHNVINERIVKSTDMDDLMEVFKVAPISVDMEKNAKIYKGATDIRRINGNVTPIASSSSFEHLKNPVPDKFSNKTLARLHLAPLYVGLIKDGLLSEADVLTINKLKGITPTVNVLHVTQDLFNDFLKYVKENQADFGKALKEVLAVGDDLDGSNKYHLMGLALNEAVKSGMVKTGVQTITLSLIFRMGDVKIHINHYTNRANVTERTVTALTNTFSRILYQDLKPFLLEWEGREVHGTFRVDGTNNNIYVVDVINGRTVKEKVSISTTSEIASANFTDTETISDIASKLIPEDTFAY